MRPTTEIAEIFRVAQHLAADLAGAEVDPNEAQKALSYLRSKGKNEALFDYLKAIMNNGSVVIRSRRTLNYYRALERACEYHLRPIAKDESSYETLLLTFGWSLRLLRYYRAVPWATEGEDEEKRVPKQPDRQPSQPPKQQRVQRPLTSAPSSRQTPVATPAAPRQPAPPKAKRPAEELRPSVPPSVPPPQPQTKEAAPSAPQFEQPATEAKPTPLPEMPATPAQREPAQQEPAQPIDLPTPPPAAPEPEQAKPPELSLTYEEPKSQKRALPPGLPGIGAILTGKVLERDDHFVIVKILDFDDDEVAGIIKVDQDTPKYRVGKSSARAQVLQIRHVKDRVVIDLKPMRAEDKRKK